MGQLKMIFDATTTAIPEPVVPEGFTLRTVRDGELAEYSALRVSAEFKPWTIEDMAKYLERALPDALYLAVETATGRFAASAGAEHSANPDHPEFGNLGWVMAHPDMRGRHLGRTVSLAAMRRLYQAGYRTFSLSTDDFRLPAVKTYLQLGWRPWLIEPDMIERWEKVGRELGLVKEAAAGFPADHKFAPKVEGGVQ